MSLRTSLILFFALCGHMWAQDLPHQAARISLWTSAGTRTADAVQTCLLLHRGQHEISVPAPFDSCHGVAIWNAGSVGLGYLSQKLIHRVARNHPAWHRWEWIGNTASTAGATEGIIHNSLSWDNIKVKPLPPGKPVGVVR